MKFLRRNSEEKIHGSLQVGIQQGKNDDGEISSNTQYVGEKQKEEIYSLYFWIIGQTQEDEVGH